MAGGYITTADSGPSGGWSTGTRYFTQVTEDNHAAWLWIITLLSLIYVLVAFVIRFVVKYGMASVICLPADLLLTRWQVCECRPVHLRGPCLLADVDAISYGNDDWALLSSTMLAVGQYIAVLAGLSQGLGKSQTLLSAEQISGIEKSTTAHIFMYFLAHCLSKVSTALLTLRLFENGRSRNAKLSWALVLLSATYGVGTVLAASINCSNPIFPQLGDNTCPNRFLRFRIVLALDVITETFLVVVPLALVLSVLIKRSSKITVTAIFAFRLMDIVFAALNLHQIEVLRTSDDYGTSLVPPMIWTQVELLWSILAASLPCLKSFVRPFEKVDEETWRSGQGYSSSRSGVSWGARRTQNYEDGLPLESMCSRTHAQAQTTEATGSHHRPDSRHGDAENHAIIGSSLSHPSRVEDERRSWGSQDRIVQVSRQWPADRHGSGSGPAELA